MSKSIKIIVVVVFVFLLGIGSFFVFKKDIKSPVEDLVGGDRDQRGCIASAGYEWCEEKTKCLRTFEEFCPDYAREILEAVKNETGVALLPMGETVFNWVVNEEEELVEMKIYGSAYSAGYVSWEDFEKIEDFLSRDMEANSYNSADEKIKGARGYLAEYMVCNMEYGYMEIKTGAGGDDEPVGDKLNLVFSCGYFNENDIPKIIAEDKIREELSGKYQKNKEEISVEISRLADNHAAGSVSFAIGEAGEGGVFLAVKRGGDWQTVFDGNGSVDCEAMREEYGFPEEILKPDFCD